jgi:hypothetical protein
VSRLEGSCSLAGSSQTGITWCTVTGDRRPQAAHVGNDRRCSRLVRFQDPRRTDRRVPGLIRWASLYLITGTKVDHTADQITGVLNAGKPADLRASRHLRELVSSRSQVGPHQSPLSSRRGNDKRSSALCQVLRLLAINSGSTGDRSPADHRGITERSPNDHRRITDRSPRPLAIIAGRVLLQQLQESDASSRRKCREPA